ncbi:MAG: mechanosensitive ion channel domain-containing protein [bacterium]
MALVLANELCGPRLRLLLAAIFLQLIALTCLAAPLAAQDPRTASGTSFPAAVMLQGLTETAVPLEQDLSPDARTASPAEPKTEGQAPAQPQVGLATQAQPLGEPTTGARPTADPAPPPSGSQPAHPPASPAVQPQTRQSPPAAQSQAPGQKSEVLPITFADDMGEAMRKEAARMSKELSKGVRPLFKRKPLGFDLETIDRVRTEAIALPLRVPALIEHVIKQSRLLGFVGSMIMLAFLVAVFYSLFGQRKVLDRVERRVEPLIRRMPQGLYPYFLSFLKILVASLIPLILFGAFALIQAFTSYQASWFWLTGKLLKLWAVGALLLNLLRESLTRDLLPVPRDYGRSIHRVARMVVLYILGSVAVFWAAEAFRLPKDFLALLKFLLSLSIVFALLFLILKKKSILGILPDLPYGSYQAFRRALQRFYFPIMFLTFLTGLLWCVGYQRLCVVLWTKTWAVAGSFLGIMVAYHLVQERLQKWIANKTVADESAHFLYRAVRSLLLYATVIFILLATLKLLGLMGPAQRVMSFPIVKVGSAALSLWTLFKAAFILLAFVYISRFVRAWLDYKVYPSIGVDEGLAYAINTFLSYMLLAVGFLFSLRAVGLDLRVLMVFAGALGIGIGLGLQSLFANLAAGFSLVFGRLVRKGDWIQVGDTLGNVLEVSLRSTKVRTRDNIEYLIPNADLVANTIINYTLSDPLVRVHVPVGASYSCRPREVERILLEAAALNPNLSRLKPPEVWLSGYGESSLDFDLLVWIDIRKIGERRIRSELYHAIFDALGKAGIEIPFPQRDLHIRSGLPLSAKASVQPERASVGEDPVGIRLPPG